LEKRSGKKDICDSIWKKKLIKARTVNR